VSDKRVWWIASGEDAYWDAEFHRATCDWVSSLGLDPDWLLPDAEVWERDDGVFEFHAEQIVRDESGKPKIDPSDRDHLLTISVNLSVRKNSWPARPTEATV